MKTVYQIVKEYKDREWLNEHWKKTDKEAIDSFKHLSACFKELADKLEELTNTNTASSSRKAQSYVCSSEV